MADQVTGKSLAEEEKRIKGAVDHNIKMQVKKIQNKSWRRNVEVRK